MKLGIYNVINNPLPQLATIKEIDVNEEDFEYDEKIVNIMNNYLNMDKLSSEYVYALSLTYNCIPRGIVLVSVGKCDQCNPDVRELATGLLLTGAEQFMCFHNHPGYNKKISKDDVNMTNKYKEIGNLIGIHFLKHIMITKDFYDYCNDNEEFELPFV